LPSIKIFMRNRFARYFKNRGEANVKLNCSGGL
jgi:hypothetical protein